MFKKLFVAFSIVFALGLTGCASKAKKTSGVPVAPRSDTGMVTSGISDSSLSDGSSLDDKSGLDLSQRTVYFAYDSTDLTPEGQQIVAHFGRYLSSNPSARIRLEGNADERGTREYNIGLGERRALAVQSALISYGASANQMSVVSYGEERPAVEGHDESAWAMNRRVEIIQL